MLQEDTGSSGLEAVQSVQSVPEWFVSAHALLPHPHYRDPGEDVPWAMPIVLEIPKKAKPSRTALLEASAQAVVACCLDPRAADETSLYREGLVSWYGARIRKLSRRARGIAWERVQLAPGVTATVSGASARALVPTPVEEVYPEVAKLQISGTDLPYDAPDATDPATAAGEDAASHPIIWVDRDLGMSVGKVAAQVGHGSMLYAATLSADAAWAWAQTGYDLEVREVPRGQWPPESERAVEVRDAGFTEIAPGSVTVAVTR
nr:peptidyl-tRNA hydrolase [Corynebacterium lactis]